MTEFSSFLVMPAIISGVLFLIIILLYKWTFKSKHRNLWIGLTVFFAFYSLVVGSAALTDIKYQKELASYDLDKDGLFAASEITPNQEAAMFRLTNDLGRNLTVFSGAIFGGIMGFVAFLIAWGFDKYKRLKIEEETNHKMQ